MTTAVTRGLRTAATTADRVDGRTWRFTPSAGGAPIVFALGASDTTPAALAQRLDALLAPAGVGIARVGEHDQCVYVELIDTAATIAVYDGSPPAMPLGPGVFGQDAIPSPRPGAQRDMWVDAGMQLRVTDLPRTCRLVAFVPDGSPAGSRPLDPGWVRLPTDYAGNPGNTPGLVRIAYGALARADAARSDNYTEHGDMLVSTGVAKVGGEDLPVVHRARYWVSLDGSEPLGPIRLDNGDVVLEVPRA